MSSAHRLILPDPRDTVNNDLAFQAYFMIYYFYFPGMLKLTVHPYFIIPFIESSKVKELIYSVRSQDSYYVSGEVAGTAHGMQDSGFFPYNQRSAFLM